jgi:hypothetical protein
MATESSDEEPQEPSQKFVVVNPSPPETRQSKEAAQNTFKMPKPFIDPVHNHSDKTAKLEDIKKSLSLGDPLKYEEYNSEVNKTSVQPPFWSDAQTSQPPALVRERPVKTEDIEKSFVNESVPVPSTDQRVHLTDLTGSAKLVYKQKK